MNIDDFETAIESWKGQTIPQLGARLAELKRALEASKAKNTMCQIMYDMLAIDVLPDRMEDEDIEVIKIKDVGRLQVKADIRCSCPAANRDKLMAWLREHKQAALIANAVNAATLKAYVKESIKNGEDYPHKILKIEPYSRASIVKA